MSQAILKVTESKKDNAVENGAELVGFIVKRGTSYQVIADGRARNISEIEYKRLMQYPD